MKASTRCDVWLRPTVAGAAPPSTPPERARWERLRSSGDRDRLATAHHLVRDVLADVLGTDPAALPLHRRCPRCGADDHGPLSVEGAAVSVSHSAGLVAVAVTAGHPVGVDVEQLRPRAPDVADRALSVRERREHDAAGGGAERAEDLLVRWVRKEAVLKAARAGLVDDLPALEVSAPGRRARVRRWSGAGRPDEARRVRLADLTAPAGYVGAVAVLNVRRLRVRLR